MEPFHNGNRCVARSGTCGNIPQRPTTPKRVEPSFAAFPITIQSGGRDTYRHITQTCRTVEPFHNDNRCVTRSGTCGNIQQNQRPRRRSNHSQSRSRHPFDLFKVDPSSAAFPAGGASRATQRLAMVGQLRRPSASGCAFPSSYNRADTPVRPYNDGGFVITEGTESTETRLAENRCSGNRGYTPAYPPGCGCPLRADRDYRPRNAARCRVPGRLPD